MLTDLPFDLLATLVSLLGLNGACTCARPDPKDSRQCLLFITFQPSSPLKLSLVGTQSRQSLRLKAGVELCRRCDGLLVKAFAKLHRRASHMNKVFLHDGERDLIPFLDTENNEWCVSGRCCGGRGVRLERNVRLFHACV